MWISLNLLPVAFVWLATNHLLFPSLGFLFWTMRILNHIVSVVPSVSSYVCVVLSAG